MKLTNLLRVTISFIGPLLVAAAPSIINGTDVPSASTYPFMVSLRKTGVFACGAAILTPSLVVTAAHCVHFMRPEDIELRAGSLEYREGGVGPIALSEIIEHPNYTEEGRTYDYDVAILRLAAPLDFSSTINAISPVAANSDPVEGTTTTIMGCKNYFLVETVHIIIEMEGSRELPREYCVVS